MASKSCLDEQLETVRSRKRTRDFHFPTTREGEVTRLDFCSTQL